ncbi:MAG: hypothetical protein WKF40_11405 [Thermoleophilaceae bacterium]
MIIALQLAMTHWFYLYVVWFAPLALVAVMAPWRTGPEPEQAHPGDSAGPGAAPGRRGVTRVAAGAGRRAGPWCRRWRCWRRVGR